MQNIWNTILHTQIVLHLFAISIFLDYISLINTRFIIEQDCSEKSKIRLKTRLFVKVKEYMQETSLSLQGPLPVLERLYLSVNRQSPRFGFLSSTVSTPSPNQEPSLVCAVAIFYLFTLSSQHLVFFSRVFFADSDSGVTFGRKTQYAVVYCYCFAYLFVGFPQSVRLNIIMFMS